MPPRYELWITDPNGVRLALLDRWESLSYAARVGSDGGFSLILPPIYSLDLFHKDGWLEVWRASDEGIALSLETEAPFYIRRVRRFREKNSKVERIEITGPRASELLSRRIVAYAANSSQAKKTAAADNLMKAVVRENFSSLATDVNRRIPSTYFTIDGDAALGPSVSMAFSRRNVMDVLKDVASASLSLGNPIFFDIVRIKQGWLEFRTYKGQRGRNRGRDSDNVLVFSDVYENIDGPERVDDATEEITHAYAGGQGEDADRMVGTAGDSDRAAISPIGRREQWIDARDVDSATHLDEEARAAVAAGRPRIFVGATLLNKPISRYGVDWGFGDRVVVSTYGIELEAWINAIWVNVDGEGREEIQGSIEVAS